MGKTNTRRKVSGKTTDDKPISIPGVSSNGNAQKNARAKGCYGQQVYTSTAKPYKAKDDIEF